MDKKKITEGVKLILEGIGEDLSREGLRGTPERVANMYAEICAGIKLDPSRHLDVQFHENYNEMIIVRDIQFYSICEHHLVPFFGKAHVGYIPKHGVVTGLSKIARVVDEIARRPQIQEGMTNLIAQFMMEKLKPMGVGVVIESEHMCMSMRGIQKQGSTTVTSAVRGCFQSDERTRKEFMSLLKLDRN